MYKNQLQELAQRSCFNLPSYTCIREGPDHAPRFKAAVTFNGEIFESPTFCSTLRQAEHAAAEVALNALSRRGPSRLLAAKVLDETGVYKNLLQETAHRAGLELPVYTTVRSGPCHTPIFTSIVELAGLSFTGDPAKTKKQAQKNAAMAAWSALKHLPHLTPSSSSPFLEHEGHEEQEQVVIARALANFWQPEVGEQSSRTNRLNGRCGLSSMLRDTHPASNSSFQSRPRQSWANPSFALKAARYQMWQQAQASQQQSHMSIWPTSSSTMDPRSLPSVQSMYHPVQEHFVSTVDKDPTGGKENERLKLSINAEVYSKSEMSVTSLWDDDHTVAKIQELALVHEKKCLLPLQQAANITKTTSDSHPSAVHDLSDAIVKQEVQTRSFECTSGESIEIASSTNNHHRSSKQKLSSFSINPSNPELHVLPPSSSLGSSRVLGHHVMQTPLMDTSLPSLDRSVSRVQALRPWTMSRAAPVTIRTAIPVCTGRPASMNPNTRVSRSRSVAPAIHIRSGALVCSAPSVRQPDSNQMYSQEK